MGPFNYDPAPSGYVVGSRNFKLVKFKNGDAFEGEVDANNNFDGQGIFVSASDGSVYEGYWAGHKKNGRGRTIYAEGGPCYEGEFVDNKK
jgi:hypothetical protein